MWFVLGVQSSATVTVRGGPLTLVTALSDEEPQAIPTTDAAASDAIASVRAIAFKRGNLDS
jgi:hypothetical protein